MLQGALSLIGVAFWLLGFCSAGWAFYLNIKRLSYEGAERKLWNRRYYKAVLMFLLGWSMAMVTVAVKYLLGFPLSDTVGQ